MAGIRIIVLVLAVWVTMIAIERAMAGNEIVVNCREDDHNCELCCKQYGILYSESREWRSKLWVRKYRHNVCACVNPYGDHTESLIRMKIEEDNTTIELQ